MKRPDSEGGLHGAFRQSMAWLHTWASIVLSIVLYFVFITGSTGYFNAEIDHWMMPEAPSANAEATEASMLSSGFAYLNEVAPNAARHGVSLPDDRGSAILRVFATLKEPNADGDRFISAQLDPMSGEPVTKRETGGGSALYQMHYELYYVPQKVGEYVVGIATLFMLLAIVTGIVTHKKILTDFFTLRLNKGQRSWLDAHNMSSVLALPFMLMITYSGLVFYEFEYSPGTIFLAMGVDREAQQEMFAHLRPGLESPEASGVSAPLIDLAGPIAAAQDSWTRARVRFVDVINPGDASARIRVFPSTSDLQRGGRQLVFDGVTGEALGAAPPYPADAALAGALLALHEGRFANSWLRWLYFASGLLGAAMVATGMLLWAKKRRTRLKKTMSAPASLIFVERTNLGIIVGLPLAVAAYFWANRLLPLEMSDRAGWEMHCLFLVWAASFAHAGLRELRRAWREQVALLALLLTTLPLLNALTTDAHLGVSLAAGDWIRAGFDLTVLLMGLALVLVWRRLTVPQPLADGVAVPARASA